MKTLNLYKFELYQLARELSRLGWKVYIGLQRNIQYSTGDQFLRSVDSVQANIAEGYGRFHFRDKMRFSFNARGSLYETLSWSEILLERNLMDAVDQKAFSDLCIRISYLLNAHIRHLNDQAKSPTR